MRSTSRIFLLALSALSVTAMAVPTLASAEWTKEGKALEAYPDMQWSNQGLPLTEAKSITLQGPMKFSGEWGNVECPMTLNGTIGTGGVGTISEVSANLASCVISGGAKAIGCKTVGSVTANELPWPAAAARSGGSEGYLLPAGVSLSYALEGGIFCYGPKKTGDRHWPGGRETQQCRRNRQRVSLWCCGYATSIVFAEKLYQWHAECKPRYLRNRHHELGRAQRFAGLASGNWNHELLGQRKSRPERRQRRQDHRSQLVELLLRRWHRYVLHSSVRDNERIAAESGQRRDQNSHP